MSEELFQTFPYLRECKAVVQTVDADAGSFTVNRTVFYPTGGGQPGDIGVYFDSSDREYPITDTQRNRATGDIDHFIEDLAQLPQVGDTIYLEIDWERRHRLMRMHSCLHLLCAVISGKVTGAQVYDGRGRVDFDTSETYDKNQLSTSLNLLIEQNAQCQSLSYSTAELSANPELVDSLSVPVPPIEGSVRLVHFDGIDIQPCGGTHVANTEEIGHVKVVKIESKGRHNRRISVVLDDRNSSSEYDSSDN
ncbi:MAG: alanyl-tRNA editing protein [Acidiferrobacterales bacterium]|nr:alanyl-tRNA editing protein [Acidiferrobacterales bacterium]